jgi:hypothetical protein
LYHIGIVAPMRLALREAAAPSLSKRGSRCHLGAKEPRVCTGRHVLLAVRPEATGSLFSVLGGLWESLFAFRLRGRLAGFLPRHTED